MTDVERIEQRLRAIERTLLEDGQDRTISGPDSTAEADLERIEDRLDALEDRVADLEATAQSIDGYVSAVESVNRAVERRADAALATVDRLESRLDAIESRPAGDGDGPRSSADDGATNRPGDRPEPRDRECSTDDAPDSNANATQTGLRGILRDGIAGLRERIS